MEFRQKLYERGGAPAGSPGLYYTPLNSLPSTEVCFWHLEAGDATRPVRQADSTYALKMLDGPYNILATRLLMSLTIFRLLMRIPKRHAISVVGVAFENNFKWKSTWHVSSVVGKVWHWMNEGADRRIWLQCIMINWILVSSAMKNWKFCETTPRVDWSPCCDELKTPLLLWATNDNALFAME